MNKTPFTHEGLIERGFIENGYYKKELGRFASVLVYLNSSKVFLTMGESNDKSSVMFTLLTTITTIEDLDLFLSYIKHE